jgi:DNA-binding SARP family transcriptional activator
VIFGRDWSLRLLGCWQLHCGNDAVYVGARQQRLITLLALQGTQSRRSVAARLWPDSSSARAGANLRASLFKISHEQPGMIQGSVDTIGLDPSVEVDVISLRSALDDVLKAGVDAGVVAVLTADLAAAELLPGCSDDWVLSAQERLDQQRLLVLESASRRCLQAGDVDRAVEVATLAVQMAPLRESAYRLLMEAHLGAGNRALAARVYQQLCDTLSDELGVAPCVQFDELVSARTQPRVPVTFL